jgi:hypothetical protein
MDDPQSQAGLAERCRKLEADIAARQEQLAKLDLERKQRKAALSALRRKADKAERGLKDSQQRLAASGGQRVRVGGKVKLDVGGHHFTTSVTTLTSETDSMLAAMFSGRHEHELDNDGRVFIDRDPKAFALILDWLRNGHLPAHMTSERRRFNSESHQHHHHHHALEVDKQALVLEATYYGLTRLVDVLTDANKDKDAKRRHEEKKVKRAAAQAVAAAASTPKSPLRGSGDRSSPRSRPILTLRSSGGGETEAAAGPARADADSDDDDSDGDDDAEGECDRVRLSGDQFVQLLNSGRPLQLSGCDLRGFSLSGMKLVDARFFQCDLRGVDLRWAILQGASLVECDLRRANLIGASIHACTRCAHTVPESCVSCCVLCVVSCCVVQELSWRARTCSRPTCDAPT